MCSLQTKNDLYSTNMVEGKNRKRVMFMMWKLYVIRFQVSINPAFWNTATCLTAELVVAALLWKHNSEAVMETGLQILNVMEVWLLYRAPRPEGSEHSGGRSGFDTRRAWRMRWVPGGAVGAAPSEIRQCSCCGFGVWTVVRVPKMMVRSSSRGLLAQSANLLDKRGLDP